MYWWATLLLIFIGGQKDKWLKPGCHFVSITVIRFGRTQQIWSSQRRTAARCTLRLGHPDNDGDQDGDDDDDDEHDDDDQNDDDNDDDDDESEKTMKQMK